MSSSQHSRDQSSRIVPRVEIQDYGAEPEDDLVPPTPKQSKSHHSSRSKKNKAKYKDYSGSDTETEMPSNLPPRSSKGSSKSHKSSGKSSKPLKSDDWSEVTEPEERRRIQNRIAQRKFREKAREHRERAQRDAQNQELAGASYEIPSPDSVGPEADLSGLPWGGMSMNFVVAKGHEYAGQQQGSRRFEDNRLDPQLLSPYASAGYGGQVSSFDGGPDSSGDDQTYYQDTSSYGAYYDLDPYGGDATHHGHSHS